MCFSLPSICAIRFHLSELSCAEIPLVLLVLARISYEDDLKTQRGIQ